MNTSKRSLAEGSEAFAVARMAGGMLFGFAAMSAFNAVDTYFVGRLGAPALAAMSFTFPVILILNSISMGLGVGLSSVVSRAIGSGDHHKVQRLTTDGLALALAVVVVVSLCGILTIRPLFTLLGAGGQTLELIRRYMVIWYLGIPFVIIPMAGNNAIRATGDTLTPSLIMIVAVVVNLLLDPLLIFGLGPFPALGISGAAIATVLARFASLLLSLGILAGREKLLSFDLPRPREVLSSWKRISFVGAPAALVQVVTPLSLGVITRILAQFGETAVAGFGAAGRVEMIIMMIPMSLAAVMAPFAGQNWGARRVERITRALRFSGSVSIAWGLLAFVACFLFAEPVLALFSADERIVEAGSDYLRIVGLSYGFLGILVMSSQILSALNRPLESAAINLLKALALNIPLAVFGAHFHRETGVFFASLLTNLLGGTGAVLFLLAFLKKQAATLSAGDNDRTTGRVIPAAGR